MKKTLFAILFLCLTSCETPIKSRYQKIGAKLEATEAKVETIKKNIHKTQEIVVNLKKRPLNEECKKYIIKDVENIELQLEISKKDIEVVKNNLKDLKEENITFKNISNLELENYKTKYRLNKLLAFIWFGLFVWFGVVRRIRSFF